MNFKPTIVQEIDGHQVEVRFHGLTGRETVLVDGEEKISRLNWAMKSDYLVELSDHKHIRIRITLDLMNTLNVEFLRGGALLCQQNIELYQGDDEKLLAEPENAVWLAEVKLPYLLTLLAPIAILLGILFFKFNNTLTLLAAFMLLSVISLYWLIKPPLASGTATSHRITRNLSGALPRAFAVGISFGGIVGYSFAVFTDSISRLLGTS